MAVKFVSPSSVANDELVRLIAKYGVYNALSQLEVVIAQQRDAAVGDDRRTLSYVGREVSELFDRLVSAGYVESMTVEDKEAR